MEQGEPAACSCTDKCHAGAVNTSCSLCAVNMTECVGKEPEPEKGLAVMGFCWAVLAVDLAGGGAVYFLKFKKKKPDTKGSADLDDYDYDDEDG